MRLTFPIVGTYLGHRTMSRQQALASPLLPQILRAASIIAREQPDIHNFIRS
jgi:hypothetical protein